MDSIISLDDQLVKLEEKIKNTNLPKELNDRLEEEISLLRSSYKNSSSAGGTFINFENFLNYVHWIISLPFNNKTKDILDLNLAKQVLDKNHYGLESVKNIILEYLSSLILIMKEENAPRIARTPILCLVGLVGTGKTTLAYSIAEALGKRFERIPFGGMGSANDLRGTSRANIDAEPGIIIKSVIKTQSNNCVILLDELDRVTERGRQDIMGVLVELLDPEQNKAFIDHYIDFPFDLSNVLFIATANNTTNISTAVLDRLQLVQMPSYSDEEKLVIAKNYLFPKISKETGLTPEEIKINDDVWPGIIRPLGFDAGIRSLQRTIEGVCRKVARMIVEGKAQQVNVNSQNIKEFLAT